MLPNSCQTLGISVPYARFFGKLKISHTSRISSCICLDISDINEIEKRKHKNKNKERMKEGTQEKKKKREKKKQRKKK